MPDPESVAGGDAGGITLAGAAKWIWSNWDVIEQRLRRLVGLVKEPNDRPILILGPGGCGKTTLLHILAGDRDWLRDTPWVYAESDRPESSVLADDPAVEVIVTPGQPHRERTFWPELQGEIAAGKYRGVVLLTAFGYHTFTQTVRLKHHPLYQPGGRNPTAEFLAKYLTDRRAEELRVLRQLAPYLRACHKPVWLFTVVAKQDLWADEQAAAESHYQTGDFGTEVAALAAGSDPTRFRHELAFASLVIANLLTRGGDELKKNAAGYDQRQQVESVKRVIELLYGLAEWEGRT